MTGKLYALLNHSGITEGIYTANRNFANSRIYTGHVMPVLLDCNFSVGATGAVSNVKGPYISSITRLGVGAYQIKFQDNFNRFYSATHALQSPPTGSAADPHGQTVGNAYIITTVGNTDWTTAGVPAGVTPAIGVGYVLAAQPGAGTGRAKAIAPSGISAIEIIGNPNLTSAPSPSVSTGAVVLIQCFGPTDSTHTALIPADPVSGSTLSLSFYMSNSSVLINGE